MKQKVLVDLRVTCDPPYAVGRWSKTMEDKAKRLEEWCREFEEFIRDHRSQDPVSLNVEREYQDQCSLCGREWEEDEDGPACCNEAQAEWQKQRLERLVMRSGESEGKMRNSKNNNISDLETCKREIMALLAEYNCTIETDDYSGLWMRDKDTNETTGLRSGT